MAGDSVRDRNQQARRHAFIAGAFLVAGWALVLLSVAVYLLHWRVANEPGAGSATGLLLAAVTLGISGVAGFIGANIYLLVQRSKAVLIAWLLCVGVTIVAATLSPILLLLLV